MVYGLRPMRPMDTGRAKRGLTGLRIRSLRLPLVADWSYQNANQADILSYHLVSFNPFRTDHYDYKTGWRWNTVWSCQKLIKTVFVIAFVMVFAHANGQCGRKPAISRHVTGQAKLTDIEPSEDGLLRLIGKNSVRAIRRRAPLSVGKTGTRRRTITTESFVPCSLKRQARED